MKLPNWMRGTFGLSEMKKEALPRDEDATSPLNVRLPVQYFRQEHGNMCVDACAAMLLHYKGVQAYKDLKAMLKHNPRGAFTGASTKYIQDHYTFGSSNLWCDLDLDTQVGGAPVAAIHVSRWLNAPIIGPIKCGLRSKSGGHAVVLIGIHGTKLLFHDPWKGPYLTMSIDTFNDLLTSRKNGGMTYLLGPKRATCA